MVSASTCLKEMEGTRLCVHLNTDVFFSISLIYPCRHTFTKLINLFMSFLIFRFLIMPQLPRLLSIFHIHYFHFSN